MKRTTGVWMFIVVMVVSAWSADRAIGQAVSRNADAVDAGRPYDFHLQAEDAVAATRIASYNTASFAPQEDDEGLGGGGESHEMNWDLAGPYEMRSADPEPVGVLEMKHIFGWSTTKGESDETEYEFEIEWGVAKDHELIFEIPAVIGDGGVEGNGDLEIGWHWKLWEEDGWIPAFAMRNFLHLPTGYHSDEVDYEFIGLITKSIIPGKLRFDGNPFFRFVGGDNDEDAGDFYWVVRSVLIGG
jgi:hypothetical protein